VISCFFYRDDKYKSFLVFVNDPNRVLKAATIENDIMEAVREIKKREIVVRVFQ
jgi:hypothetical protein